MIKIKYLFLANLIVKFWIGIVCLIMALLLFVTVHSTVSPKYYDKVIFDSRGGLVYNPNAQVPLNSYAEYKEGKNPNIYFNKLTLTSKINYVVRGLIGSTLILLILLEFQNIIRSVKKYSSFFVNNSRYFKRIAFYLFIFLVYSIVTEFLGRSVFMKFPDGGVQHDYRFYRIDNYITISLFIYMSLVASVIFSEGEQLRAENELTV